MRTERFIINYPKSPAEKKRWNRLYGLNAIGVAYCLSLHELPQARVLSTTGSRSFQIKTRCAGLLIWDTGDVTHVPTRRRTQRSGSSSKRRSNGAGGFWALARKEFSGVCDDDDSRRYVRAVTHRFHDKDYILVEVTEA